MDLVFVVFGGIYVVFLWLFVVLVVCEFRTEVWLSSFNGFETASFTKASLQ